MRRFIFASMFSPGSLGLRPRQAGYSLYDLIVTSSVAGFVSLGAVSMVSVVQDTRMTAEINELMLQLNLARSEAIKRGTPVTLCISRNGTVCSKGSEWHNGWIIFSDPNENHKIDDGENIIRIQTEQQGKLALRYGGEKETYSYTTYYPEGYARPNATFTFCDGRGSLKAKAIIINAIGRPRSSVKNHDSKPLDCSWGPS